MALVAGSPRVVGTGERFATDERKRPFEAERPGDPGAGHEDRLGVHPEGEAAAVLELGDAADRLDRGVPLGMALEGALDDDVVPAPDVIECLLRHYAARPDLDGLAPVITNYVPPGRLLRLAYTVFCRGPFRDERQRVYWDWREHAGALVPVRMFTGAMMSFRRAALRGVRFDSRYRGPSVGEDIDLCWSLGARDFSLIKEGMRLLDVQLRLLAAKGD